MKYYKGQEKRKFPRLKANFVVSYRIKEPREDYDLSQTKDVGQGGLLITTNRKFEPGTILAITIRFPFSPKRIEVMGKVVDSKKVVENLIYETRVNFFGLEQETFDQLGEFINKRSKR